jgi:hypothetical protein
VGAAAGGTLHGGSFRRLGAAFLPACPAPAVSLLCPSPHACLPPTTALAALPRPAPPRPAPQLVLAFTSNWTPTGGIPEYLKWAGSDQQVRRRVSGGAIASGRKRVAAAAVGRAGQCLRGASLLAGCTCNTGRGRAQSLFLLPRSNLWPMLCADRLQYCLLLPCVLPVLLTAGGFLHP